MKTRLTLLLIPILLAACGGGETVDGNADDITGIDWQWQETRQADGQTMKPADPAAYTLRFEADGTVSLRVDCNRATGTYNREQSRLRIEVTASTRAMCPPDSLDQAFLRQLDAVAIGFLRDGKLYLDMKMDSGTMQFSR